MLAAGKSSVSCTATAAACMHIGKTWYTRCITSCGDVCVTTAACGNIASEEGCLLNSQPCRKVAGQALLRGSTCLVAYRCCTGWQSKARQGKARHTHVEACAPFTQRKSLDTDAYTWFVRWMHCLCLHTHLLQDFVFSKTQPVANSCRFLPLGCQLSSHPPTHVFYILTHTGLVYGWMHSLCRHTCIRTCCIILSSAKRSLLLIRAASSLSVSISAATAAAASTNPAAPGLRGRC